MSCGNIGNSGLEARKTLQPYSHVRFRVLGGLHTVKLQVRSWQRVIGMVSKDYGRLPTCKLPICKGLLLLKQSALPAIATHIVLDRPRKIRMQPFLLSKYPWQSPAIMKQHMFVACPACLFNGKQP